MHGWEEAWQPTHGCEGWYSAGPAVGKKESDWETWAIGVRNGGATKAAGDDARDVDGVRTSSLGGEEEDDIGACTLLIEDDAWPLFTPLPSLGSLDPRLACVLKVHRTPRQDAHGMPSCGATPKSNIHGTPSSVHCTHASIVRVYAWGFSRAFTWG